MSEQELEEGTEEIPEEEETDSDVSDTEEPDEGKSLSEY
jgi:hypothetical protein